MWNFVFLPEDSYFLTEDSIFFPGVIVSAQWSKNVAGGLILTEIQISIALFKWLKKLEGT